VDNRVDEVAELEAAISDTWSWARATARAAAQALDPRLDATAYPLVSTLGWRGAMRPSELAATLHLDKSTVSRQIDAAARLGLVEREPHPGDARAVTVRLTEDARTRLERARAARLERWRAALAEWAPDDITELTRLLRQLTAVELT
jgi:DNA-binding MarR family transcriptional regulator